MLGYGHHSRVSLIILSYLRIYFDVFGFITAFYPRLTIGIPYALIIWAETLDYCFSVSRCIFLCL